MPHAVHVVNPGMKPDRPTTTEGGAVELCSKSRITIIDKRTGRFMATITWKADPNVAYHLAGESRFGRRSHMIKADPAGLWQR